MKNTKINNFFRFETNKVDKENFRSYYFNSPKKVLTLKDPSKIKIYFKELEAITKKYYAAGFLSYELGYALEKKFKFNKKTKFPLAVFCIYEKPGIIEHRKKEPNRSIKGNYKISNLRIGTSKNKYKDSIKRIKKHLENGDIYQVNYTVRYKFDFSGSIDKLYDDLKEKQHVSYNVYAKVGDCHIVSLSPELFFMKKNRDIYVRPMKGTVRRGRTLKEDNENKRFLRSDPKNRSENIMIVDLIRNDLAKISEHGTVKVKSKFDIEVYDTLFHMTSSIESKLKKDTALFQIISALFPSGSVTGAPKIRSMEIIRDLESESRNIYTGAIGFMGPDEMKFNVAIRTLLIRDGKGEMGVGGGIVYDSEPLKEYDEARLKARFLTDEPKPFKIIETFLYEKSYRNMGLHLGRMKGSARYFGFKFNSKDILSRLKELKKKLKKTRYKIRILLERSGKFRIYHRKTAAVKKTLKIKLSNIRIDSSDPCYFHKTTNRKLYDSELKKTRKEGFFDVIFINNKDEITEGAISNIYIEKSGKVYTPKIDSGLLDGVIRKKLIIKKKVIEKKLLIKDLRKADKYYISNSIIGFRRVYMHFD